MPSIAAVIGMVSMSAVLAGTGTRSKSGVGRPEAGGAERSLRSVNASSVTVNPFLGRHFYKNPANQVQFDGSIRTSTGIVQQNLEIMREVPSAYWIDVKAKIRDPTLRGMEGILRDAASRTPAEMVVFIWYDLPNRDCHAKASNGEICCKYKPDGRCDYTWQSDCKQGLKEYKETYADPFVEVLQKYMDTVPVVVVLEPDSLPNLATNAGNPRCGGQATRDAYTHGIKYAVEQLTAKAPQVAVYIDAAHGGWLGWQNNLRDFLKMLRGMNMPLDKVRGFATNVANYQPLGQLCPHQPGGAGTRNDYCLNGKHQTEACCADPCGLAAEWNPGNNELNYAQELAVAAKDVLGMDAHMIIDTGRNGVPDNRQDCAHWCNARGAGAGRASTTNTAAQFVDAYFWLKTPGESDGCTELLPGGAGICPRFDADCASPDSIGSAPREPRAPEAGHWFDYQVKQLAEFARLGASSPARSTPKPTSTPKLHPTTTTKALASTTTPSTTPRPTSTPTPAPPSSTPRPVPTPNPTPGPGSPTAGCRQFCGLQDLRWQGLWCNFLDKFPALCARSYVSEGGGDLVRRCKLTGSKCRMDIKNELSCPKLKEVCAPSATLLQKGRR